MIKREIYIYIYVYIHIYMYIYVCVLFKSNLTCKKRHGRRSESGKRRSHRIWEMKESKKAA